MAHALALGGRTPAIYETTVADVRLDESRGLFLSGTANLTNHHDCLGCRVSLEQGQDIDKTDLGWITADTDAGGLTKPGVCGLLYGLIGQVPDLETMPTRPGR